MELDVTAMRKLWRHVSPHLEQPKTDDECLTTMHMARRQMQTIPAALRTYSETWLAERRTSIEVVTTGVMVRDATLGKPRGIGVAGAMIDAVERSAVAGLHPEFDAAEVRRRMMAAREKEHMRPFAVRL